MKAKIIKYERLVNKGNYEHEKYGIEIELDPGDDPEQVLNHAKVFVSRQISPPTEREREIAEKVSDYDKTDLPF